MLGIGKWSGTALLIGIAVASACSDESGPSNPAPTGLAASATNATVIHVSWNAATGVTQFILERAEGASGTFAEINRPAGSATSFDDSGLSPTTLYRYRIAAVRGGETSGFSAEASATTSAPQQVNVTADITANTTWTAGNIYKLVGFRKVTSGATLTIEAGTKIIGDFATVGSSLFVLRGARIVANGTAAQPVVFTSSVADGSRQPGDWGGLILIGNGLINRSGTVDIEGTGTSTDNPLVPYGCPGCNTNNADNSGALHYVRVEYAGFGPAPNAELNSFTFAAIGSGTALDHLQSLNGLDDSFEFFGGAVDGKYLVSYESGDDHFDMSEGYVGRLQFLIGFQSRVFPPRPGVGSASTDPQGIENDGCNGSGCDLGFNSTPFTVPVVANFTLIGTGPGVVPSGGGFGAVLRRGTGGHYINGVFGRWPNAGIGYRNTETKQRETDGLLSIKNLLIVESPLALEAGQQSYDLASNNVVFEAATTAASLFTKLPAQPAGPTAVADFDWSLSTLAAARTGGLTTFTGDLLTRAGSFVTGTVYRGAADPAATSKWWEGWTAYHRN
ncbi:MAG TPA: fibronectin type III domain-containing protein [Gemmatimonadales bacterium]|nr:fibronectin type III domain-containing protein [Gemmatimonadales bacterium]